MDFGLDTIFNEDCLVGMKRIPDNSVDAIICDLPYGTTACKWDSVIPFEPLWEQYKRVTKPNAAIVLFGQEPFSSMLRMSNIAWFRYDWIWDKVTATGMNNAKSQPMREHEVISVFSKVKAIYNPQMEKMEKGRTYKCYKASDVNPLTYYDGKIRTTNEKYPKSILRFSNADHTNRHHPTQKPVDLIAYLIRTYSNEGEIVLDNCMGSGTTAIAAMREHRHFIGFELNKEYYDKACERIRNEQAQLTLQL